MGCMICSSLPNKGKKFPSPKQPDHQRAPPPSHPGGEADHSTTASAEVKNEWSYNPIPPPSFFTSHTPITCGLNNYIYIYIYIKYMYIILQTLFQPLNCRFVCHVIHSNIKWLLLQCQPGKSLCLLCGGSTEQHGLTSLCRAQST